MFIEKRQRSRPGRKVGTAMKHAAFKTVRYGVWAFFVAVVEQRELGRETDGLGKTLEAADVASAHIGFGNGMTARGDPRCDASQAHLRRFDTNEKERDPIAEPAGRREEPHASRSGERRFHNERYPRIHRALDRRDRAPPRAHGRRVVLARERVGIEHIDAGEQAIAERRGDRAFSRAVRARNTEERGRDLYDGGLVPRTAATRRWTSARVSSAASSANATQRSYVSREPSASGEICFSSSTN